MTQSPTADRALPERPRLLPGLAVLDRAGGELQIGLDPRHGVVAEDLPADIVDVLRRLDGSRTTRSLLGSVADDHVERLREILTALSERRLVEEAAPRRGRRVVPEPELWSLRTGVRCMDVRARRAQSTVTLHGNGRLAVAVATLLAVAGVGHLEIESTGHVTEADLGSGFSTADLGRSRRHAIADTVRRANPDVRTTRLPGDRRADLVLLTDAVVPAPELVRELVGDGLPHLAVRVRDGLGIVGPLVFPGRSSCLRCADLHRTDLDSSWPLVASQLAGHAQHAELTSVQATAALAAGQVLRVLAPATSPPPVWNATLEIDSYVGGVRRRTWEPHPACGCGAMPVEE
ncbi:thiamin biosynthesis protein [Amycolatopsis antarctica]|uniref:Thiamin biosynthesis protein n=1 Tax=Amycolatopsis antarctica TaxID=1854586 RepID=A0A263CVC2_9PSEU|nr:ThiF family adenylyltransferase [Amycolatopsis antarctica]OZM69938.1 thiamin biosynthesis protein [Amycolatopsis antarctica]